MPTSVTATPAPPPPADVQYSFDLRVPLAPTSHSVAGTPTLVYELHLANFTPVTLTLTGLQVHAANDARVLADFGPDRLDERIGRPSTSAADPLVFAPGANAVVYVEIALDAAMPAPRALLHRVEYGIVDASGRTSTRVSGARTVLEQRPVAKLSPPLRGGPWVAIYDASWPRGHRRVIYAIDGQARIPGRHAIDWVKLDAQGRKFPPGRDDQATARYGYGEPVLAVADAVVVAARDDMAESATISGRSKQPLGKGAGNYIALELSDGRYVLYEHLKPGSLRMAAGDRVEAGQVIAELGFTGDSTGPHLHLHVADAAAPLAAEGLPYVFDRYQLLGRYQAIEAVGTTPWRGADGTDTHHGQRPAPLSVIAFP